MTFITPKKSLGQNFLKDKSIISKIISSFNPKPDDIVLEIGPGMGALTGELLNHTEMLIAVEIDNRATEYLKTMFVVDEKKFKLFEQSILDFKISSIIDTKNENKKIRIIGNIPYNLSSDILFYLIENRNYIADAQLMVQKEVADRFTAKKNTKEYGVTTIAINLTADCHKLFDVPSSAFYPSPKVKSSVINIKFEKMISEQEYRSVMNIVKTLFNQRRKQIKNTISQILINNLKEKSGAFIDYYSSKKQNFFQLRPENLSSEDYLELYYEVKNFN